MTRNSILREEHLNDRLAYALQGVKVDVLHVIVDGVPRGTETTLFAFGIERNDVDARNVGHGVHRDMVVGDVLTVAVGEHTAIAYHAGGGPHLFYNLRGILLRETLLIETGSLTAHHVEQDAEAITGNTLS